MMYGPARWLSEVVGAEPGDLSSIPRTHTVKGTHVPKLFFDVHLYAFPGQLDVKKMVFN